MASKPRLVTLVPIRNMSRAIRFYTGKLGARLGERGRGAMKNFWASLRLGGADLWLVAPEKREVRKLAYNTLLVGNIKRFVGTLVRKGVRFEKAQRMGPTTRIDGPIAYEKFGASAFFRDSEGNLLMVWQNAVPM